MVNPSWCAVGLLQKKADYIVLQSYKDILQNYAVHVHG